jgi:hypothetical protein
MPQSTLTSRVALPTESLTIATTGIALESTAPTPVILSIYCTTLTPTRRPTAPRVAFTSPSALYASPSGRPKPASHRQRQPSIRRGRSRACTRRHRAAESDGACDRIVLRWADAGIKLVQVGHGSDEAGISGDKALLAHAQIAITHTEAGIRRADPRVHSATAGTVLASPAT